MSGCHGKIHVKSNSVTKVTHKDIGEALPYMCHLLFLQKPLQHFVRRRGVGAGLHRAARPALAQAAHGAGVAEQLGQRGLGVEHGEVAAGSASG